MSELPLTIRLAVRSDSVREELVHILNSMKGYRLVNSGNASYCDVLIMEVGDDINREFNMVHTLRESGAVREIFLTSTRTESDILLRAMRSGAREFFPQPLHRDDVRDSLTKFRAQWGGSRSAQGSGNMGKVITVMGGKGGVGTTTVAVNLAASLNAIKQVKSVALIDMNLLFGDIPLFLDLKRAVNWGEVVRHISRVDSTYLKSALAKHDSGLHILPSPTEFNAVDLATPDVIEQLLGIMKRHFDYIVIDNGQSLNDVSRKVLELSDHAFVVSILTLPCLINVKRLLQTFKRLGFPSSNRVDIIMNRYHKKSVISMTEAEEGVGKKISWLIPNDFSTAMSSINQGKLISSVSRKSDIAKSFVELAGSLGKREAAEKGGVRVLQWKAASL